MIKVKGYFKGTTKGNTINPILFKAYWTNPNGEKIEKAFPDSVVRLYVEKFWAYNVMLRVYIASNSLKSVILEKTLKELLPLYFFKEENFIEINLNDFISLIDFKNSLVIKLCCSVVNGFGYYYETEVTQLEIKYYCLNVTRKWEYKMGAHSNQATISTFCIEGTDIKGYILEPIGESTTISGLDQRIPVGVYNLQWHISKKYNKKKYKDKYLNNGFPKLYNENVSASRAILIHRGNSGAHSLGCLLPGTGKNANNSQITGSTKAFNCIIDLIEKVGIENVKVVISEDIKKIEE